MASSLIFIGSTHGFVEDFLKQKEIIESIEPEFVLSEDLENLKLDSRENFNKLLVKKYISNMTSFKEIQKLVKLCFSKKIKLIGIDLKNFGFNKILQKKLKNKEKLTIKEEKELKRIIKKREKNHLKNILECQNKTSRPIVIILGSWHLRKGSFLRRNLQDYKIIAPCDDAGNIILGPKKDLKVKYKEVS